MLCTTEYTEGDRVQLHPCTAAWMKGERYGEIVRITAQKVHVQMDKTSRIIRLDADLIDSKVW